MIEMCLFAGMLFASFWQCPEVQTVHRVDTAVFHGATAGFAVMRGTATETAVCKGR